MIALCLFACFGLTDTEHHLFRVLGHWTLAAGPWQVAWRQETGTLQSAPANVGQDRKQSEVSSLIHVTVSIRS